MLQPSSPTALPTRKFVIGLDRSPKRTEAFFENNKHIPDIEFFHGIDGRELDLGTLDEHTLRPGTPWEAGDIGCGLTHVKLWRKCIELNSPITIFEIDAALCKNFNEESERLIKKLPPNWDLVIWGYNSDCCLSVSLPPCQTDCCLFYDHDSIVKHFRQYQHLNIDSNALPLNYALGLAAYSISPRGAKKLLHLCLPFRQEFFKKINRSNGKTDNYGTETYAIDILMCKNYPLINAYVSFPVLVAVPNGLNSEMLEHREKR